MKIHLVNPSCAIEEGRDLYTNDVATALFTMRPFKRLALGMPLALPTLAAHTPSQHQVKIIDEEIEDIDFQEPVDLVGITAMSFKAKRAYEIAHEYRRHGAAVVLGGIHASMCPDEALQHVDSVVIGEAEDIWPAVVSDAESGQLKKIYRADGFPELERANIPRYDLVKNKRYGYSYLQTTRGCPYSCKFCTVTKQNGHKVLSSVDALLLTEVYPAGEAPIVAADGRALARAVRVAGKVEPIFVENVSEFPEAVQAMVQDGDVVLVMGAGSIGQVAHNLATHTLAEQK